MTLIICANTKCMYSKERKDGLSQCRCSAIGINQKNECDTYMVLPEHVKPKPEFTEPRYDDIFFEGVAELDKR